MSQICQSSTTDDEFGNDDMAAVEETLKALEEAAATMANARALVRQAEGQVSTCPLLTATVNPRHPYLTLWHQGPCVRCWGPCITC